jgi:hypothetical protein
MSANDRSATFCGCDEGANYICVRHLKERAEASLSAAQNAGNSVESFKGLGGAPTRARILPQEPQERKKHPVASGVLDYFPDALVEIARVSWEGNEQHNPGQPLHWARGKSTDEADTMIRHFLQRGQRDKDGMRHTAKMAWRALALLQKELESEL